MLNFLSKKYAFMRKPLSAFVLGVLLLAACKKSDIPAIAYLVLFIPAIFGALRARIIPAPIFLISLI